METYNCPLDGKITVIEIEADQQFTESFGWACTIIGEVNPIIIVDSKIRLEKWFTGDHLLAIFAHELGHIRGQTTDEHEAEVLGCEVLEESGLMEAHTILWERMLDRATAARL